AGFPRIELLVVTVRQIEIEHSLTDVVKIYLHRAHYLIKSAVGVGANRQDRTLLSFLQDDYMEPPGDQGSRHDAVQDTPAELAGSRVGAGNKVKILAAAIENRRLRMGVTVGDLMILPGLRIVDKNCAHAIVKMPGVGQPAPVRRPVRIPGFLIRVS